MNFPAIFHPSHFQAAVVVSMMVHTTFLFNGLGNSSLKSANQSEIKSAQLPVSVELVSFSPVPPVQGRGLRSGGRLVRSNPSSEKESPLKPPSGIPRPKVKTSIPSHLSLNEPPVYPPLARLMGQEGRVILEAHLDDAGKVIRAHIAQSSGFSSFDRAALDAVRKWRMALPKNGSRRLFIPVTFELKSSS